MRDAYAFPVAVFREKKERVGEREALSHSDTEADTAKRGRSHMAAWATNANGAGREGRRAERLRARGLADA